MRNRCLLGSIALIVIVIAVSAAPTSAQVSAVAQTPAQLCGCGGDDSAKKGGLPNFEAFKKKYGSTFNSAAEQDLAWKVYQTVNHCDAVMVIGLLKDTGGFEGKSGSSRPLRAGKLL